MGKQAVLHVDHNHQRQNQFCRNLEPLGLELHRAPNHQLAIDMMKKRWYRLVIVHFDTVGEDIFNLCSFVRSGSAATIVIALMADARINIEEQLFDCGVNDVVVGKQASGPVLAKRIRAHLHSRKSLWCQTNKIRLKDTLVDFERREVRCNGTVRRLPGILADLLKYFVDNPDRIISRSELFSSYIWADSICTPASEGGKTFDVNVSKLRKIIEADPVRPQIIESVRGLGWKLATGVIG